MLCTLGVDGLRLHGGIQHRALGKWEESGRILSVDPGTHWHGRRRRSASMVSSSLGDPQLLGAPGRTRRLSSIPGRRPAAGCSLHSKEMAPSAKTNRRKIDDVLGASLWLHPARTCLVDGVELLIGQKRRSVLHQLLLGDGRCSRGARLRPRCHVVANTCASTSRASSRSAPRGILHRVRRPRRPRHCGVEQLGDLLQQRAGHLQAAPATAERGLDRHRAGRAQWRRPPPLGAAASSCPAPAALPPCWPAAGRRPCRPGLGSLAVMVRRIEISPASITAWAKLAFSARNP